MILKKVLIFRQASSGFVKEPRRSAPGGTCPSTQTDYLLPAFLMAPRASEPSRVLRISEFLFWDRVPTLRAWERWGSKGRTRMGTRDSEPSLICGCVNALPKFTGMREVDRMYWEKHHHHSRHIYRYAFRRYNLITTIIVVVMLMK